MTSSIQNISIYIPRVFANISKERMIGIFNLLDIGVVKDIDFIAKFTNKGDKYNSAYVHFDYWYDNISNQNLQDRLLNQSDKETRIVYDDPWYWIVLENKAQKKDYSVPNQRINVTGLMEQVKKVREEKEKKMFEPRVLTLKKLNIIEKSSVVVEE